MLLLTRQYWGLEHTHTHSDGGGVLQRYYLFSCYLTLDDFINMEN